MEPTQLDEASPESLPEEVPVALLVFRVGPIWYAASALRVRSIVGATASVPIPGTPPFIAGVVSVMGRIVVVLDMGLLLGKAQTATATHLAERLVLFETDGSLIAVLTDEVAGVANIVPSRLTTLPGDDDQAALQTFNDGDRHVTVVDVPKMLQLADNQVRQRGGNTSA
jgi:chemotaxis signal transduction protein